VAKKGSILVVDDQLGVRRLLQELFGEEGFDVLLAGHGGEALELAKRQTPTLALVDVKMPVMDGLETLRALKQVYPDLPVVMMTAVGDGERVAEALKSGALKAITKPFDVFAVRTMVLDLIQDRSPKC